MEAGRLVHYLSLVGWSGRRRLALYWASGDRCTGLYTAAIEGDPAGEGAGVGGGGSLRPSRFSPGLLDNRPALSVCPALLPSPQLGEVGREADPLVRVDCVEKATLLWPVRKWGMPAPTCLSVLLDCSWLAPPERIHHQEDMSHMRLNTLTLSASMEGQGAFFWATNVQADRLKYVNV